MSRVSGFLLSSWLKKRARRKAVAGEKLLRLRQERDALLRTVRELEKRGIQVKVPKLSRGGLTKGARIARLEEDIRKLEEAIEDAGKRAAEKEAGLERQAAAAKKIAEAFTEAKKEEALADIAFDYIEGRIPKEEIDKIMSRLNKRDREVLLKWIDIATVEVIAKKMAYGVEVSEEDKRFIDSLSKELRAHFEFSKEFYSFIDRLVNAGDIEKLSPEDRQLYEWIKQDAYWSRRLKKTLAERVGE